jgi:HNH endonuclease
MSITPRTRKILWVKAGGRCSMCHEQLATDATDQDDPSVFGEECHIVAQSPGGPRATAVADLDDYDNLILLCRKHHKQVDDQRSYFTVERLQKIKGEHEEREARRDADGPVRLISDPTKPTPKMFRLCLTGQALLQSVNGAHSFWPSYPEYLSDEQADAVDALLDDLRDYLDVASEMSYRQGRLAAKEFGEHIKRLADVGMVVGIRDRHMLLTGGPSQPSSWRGFEIQFQCASEARFANADGIPLVSAGEAER